MALQVFLSYKREDIELARVIERSLRASGLRAWRDLEALPMGAPTSIEIEKAISHQCGAFMCLVTDDFLKSDFIWEVEVASALRRARETRGKFTITPVFADESLIAKFADKSRSMFGHNLSEHNGVVLESGVKAEALNRLSGRLLSNLINEQDYTRVKLFTHGDIPTSENSELIVDLRQSFVDSNPSEDEWKSAILPGLRNVKKALLQKARPQRSVWLPSRIHLSAALAFGWVFREVSGFSLDPSDDLLAENDETILDPKDLPLLEADIRRVSSHDSNLALAVSLTKDVVPTLDRMIANGTYKCNSIIEMRATTVSNTSIVNTHHAMLLAKQVVETLLDQKDRFRTTRTDLFVSSSVQFAAYLGYYLNACGDFQYWQYSMLDDAYVSSVKLSFLYDNDT